MQNNSGRNLNWKKGKESAKLLIEVLHCFTDGDLEKFNNCESLQKYINTRWEGTDLWVKKTRLQDLVELTQKWGKTLDKEQIRNALHCLKQLNIMEDQRGVTNSKTITGSDKWCFVLKFHSRCKEENRDWLFGKEETQGEWERRKVKQPEVLKSRPIQDPITPLGLAKDANNRGFNLKQAGELVEARKEFELAIKINPDNGASYYTLGVMYEEAGKVDLAMKQYQDAAFRGFAAAYCNLARLYLLEYKDFHKSVEKIGHGLKLVETEKVEHDKIVKAGLLTYLAWAWKEQGRYEEALAKLQEAVKLDSVRGLTYGIMAQVQENLGNDAEVVKAWKKVLEYGKSDERDEDVYIGKARQRLKQLGGST
ncbi:MULTISPECIES: tetratricopeptide repeat protein [unclassified Microcoleus]|uniref:tetratricopeptide repeat protein n=1 Tax=unclassified Microcoleus TaxID=2642155 RepID=UPI002FD68C0B